MFSNKNSLKNKVMAIVNDRINQAETMLNNKVDVSSETMDEEIVLAKLNHQNRVDVFTQEAIKSVFSGLV